MALSPEQIAQLRGEAGLSPTPPSKGVNSDDIIAQRKAKLGITGNETVPFSESPYAKSTSEAFKQGIEKVKSSYAEGTKPGATVGDALESGLGMASGVASAVSSPVTGLVDSFFQQISNDPKIQKIANSPMGSKVLDAINTMKAPLDQISETHPDAAANISDSLNVLFTIMGLKEGISGAKKTAENLKTEIPQTISDVKSSFGTSPAGKATIEQGQKLTKINEMISRKPTVKESRLAAEQGRLQAPTEGGTFTDGKPGRIAPSDQQVQSVRTIEKYIPDADKMDPYSLHNELKTNIGEISTQLKPELQKVQITPKIHAKILKAWDEVKASQQGPFAVSNLKKIQSDFTNIVKGLNKGTLDDIWEAIKKYDDSVPDRVKNATENSDSVLQGQKDLWLENRRVLRQILDDPEIELSGTAKQAFSDMKDMYEAKENILTKAKVEEAKPSKMQKIQEKFSKHPFMTTGAAAAAGYGLKKLID